MSQNHHSHPFPCLNGINSEELRNVLDYIYLGQVEIKQNNTKSFLKIARKLLLEGLNGIDNLELNINIMKGTQKIEGMLVKMQFFFF